MFRPICPLAFFRCLSKSGTYTELRTTSFIESTGVAGSDSNNIKLLRRQSSGGCRFNPDCRRVTIPNTCTRLWLMETEREDYTPKTLNKKNHQVSSQKFRQLIRTFSFTIYRHEIIDQIIMCTLPLSK